VEIAVQQHASEVTLGPVLFNWAPERWRDFYFRIADEAPVTTVYLGEVICSKRAPLFEPQIEAVAARLSAAGKTVVFSTLTEVMSKLDRKLVESAGAADLVEANDASALAHVRGRPHHIGPFMNVYNERTLAVLARGGARNVCLPVEMPASAIRALGAEAGKLGVSVEVQVFGRLPLALSARCYHARAHGRTKDSCQFVCENDPDGMPLRTLDDTPFLAVNGIQTLSHDYLNLIGELADLREMGVTRFRLSPHSCDMVAVANIFRAVLDQRIEIAEAAARLDLLKLDAPFSNGFYYGKPGHNWSRPNTH
jgi:collagenase-like PrtC family protease